jgi:hypothetical protein
MRILCGLMGIFAGWNLRVFPEQAVGFLVFCLALGFG